MLNKLKTSPTGVSLQCSCKGEIAAQAQVLREEVIAELKLRRQCKRRNGSFLSVLPTGVDPATRTVQVLSLLTNGVSEHTPCPVQKAAWGSPP